MANSDLVSYENLLCEHCKQAIVLARAAHEALEKLKAHTNGVAVLPALPASPPPEPQPWEGRPGKELTREERLAKAKHLMKKPDAAHTTSNGTVVAEPWRAMPRKKIRISAEKDIDRVVAGKMSQVAWVEKHGYSRALLAKRLAVRGVTPHKPGTGVVESYKAPREVLTEEEILRVVNGEISGNRLADAKGLPTGTVYRLVQKYAKSKRLRILKPPGVSGKRSLDPKGKGMSGRKTRFAIEQVDIDRYLSNAVTRDSLVKKYGCSTALIWYYASVRAKALGLKYDRLAGEFRRDKPDKGKQVPMFEKSEPEEPESAEADSESDDNEARAEAEADERDAELEKGDPEIYRRLNEALQ